MFFLPTTKESLFQHYNLTIFLCWSLNFLLHKEEEQNAQKIRENVLVYKKKSAYVIYESSKSNEDDYDDDDYDDFDADDHAATLSDNEDFLEDYEDDVSVTSASTTVSTGEYFKMFE